MLTKRFIQTMAKMIHRWTDEGLISEFQRQMLENDLNSYQSQMKKKLLRWIGIVIAVFMVFVFILALINYLL